MDDKQGLDRKDTSVLRPLLEAENQTIILALFCVVKKHKEIDMKKARHIFFGMNQLLNHRSCFVFSNKCIAVGTRMSHILHVIHAERNQTAGDAPKRKENYFDYCLSTVYHLQSFF